MFKRNVGILDRIVRVALGVALLLTGLFLPGGLLGNVLGLVIAGLGSIGLVTGLTGFCLLYVPFGINTIEKEKELVSRSMARCMSMMTSFRQGTVSSGNPSAMQMCGPCSPMVDDTRNEQA